MRKWSFTYLFLTILIYSKAQTNYVLNGDFEDTTGGCPAGGVQLISQYQDSWFDPIASSDYYNYCGWKSNAAAFYSVMGFYDTLEFGYGCAGIGNGSNSSNTSEYIETKLQFQLLPNIFYLLSFFVKPTRYYAYCDGIGGYLSKDSLYYTSTTFFYVEPQVENPSGNILNDTSSWYKISGYFFAQGGERFLTIGNFKKANEIQIQPNGASNQPYYLIDNVSLVEAVYPGDTITQFYFAPNITSGSTTLVYSVINENEIAYISIFDATGRIIYKSELDKFGYQHFIDVSSFAQGLYIWKVHTNSKVLKTGKLEVIK